MDRAARGQARPEATPPAARYQISAWGFGHSPIAGAAFQTAGERGCYILDTFTGELRHAMMNYEPKNVDEKIQ